MAWTEYHKGVNSDWTISGDDMTRNQGAQDNSYCYSDAATEVSNASSTVLGNWMFGLVYFTNNDPTTGEPNPDDNPDDRFQEKALTLGLKSHSSGTMDVYINGSLVSGQQQSWVLSDTWGVSFDGSTARFSKNGSDFYSQSYSRSETLFGFNNTNFTNDSVSVTSGDAPTPPGSSVFLPPPYANIGLRGL